MNLTIEMLPVIAIFTALQLLNVILQSARSLIMAKMDSPHMSALINALAFGIYVVIVRQISDIDLIITVTVTVITNVIGVYVAYLILKKIKRDSLWKIEMVTKHPAEYEKICNALKSQEIGYSRMNGRIVTAYAEGQAESQAVKAIIDSCVTVRYNVTEITKKL
jgi:hypothetical protein